MRSLLKPGSFYLLLFLLLSVPKCSSGKKKLRRRPVNQCTQGIHNCNRDAICIDLRRTGRKSYKCKCKSGYYGNGKICIDENECSSNNGGCVHKCDNQPGNYTCSCMSGFQLAADGHDCEDVDECKPTASSQGNGGCEQICNNTVGSFYCSCKSGYYLNADGKTCTANSQCHRVLGCAHFCSQTPQGQRCDCMEGFRLHPNGKDCIRTCAMGNGGCQHKCKDGKNGPECSCVKGYFLGENQKKCIVSCKVNNGGCEKQCIDTKTGPICACPKGYKLHEDQKSCSDVDECALDNVGCSHKCVNTHGSYECICPKGFKTQSDMKTCKDIDECSMSSMCDHICINTPGSFHCKCRDGYQRYGVTHCADINECKSNIGGCEHECENTVGSFKCKCRKGYRLHQNKLDCIKDGICLRLQAAPKVQLKCQKVDETEICIFQCNPGSRFTTGTLHTEYTFICNKETNFEWSFNNQTYTILPGCSEAVSPPSFKRKASFLMTGERCRTKKHVIESFKENLSQTLHKKKRYKCSKSCRVNNVSLECGTKRRRFWQETGKQKALITAEFEIEVRPKSLTDSCDIACMRKKTERRLKKTIKRLRKSINKEKFSVKFDNVIYGVRKRSFKAGKTVMTCTKGSLVVNDICVACAIGNYHDTITNQCLPCTKGSYQDTEGQAECKICPNMAERRGILGARNTSDCKALCGPGHFSATGMEPCQPCPIGTYQRDIGRNRCIPCGNNLKTKRVASVGFQDCLAKEICKPGQFYDVDKETCVECPVGFYQTESSQNFCSACPGDTTTDYSNSKNSSDCKDRKCGGYIGRYRGHLESPNYPGDYPNNIDCTWFIKPAKGRRILIIIPEIFLRAEDTCGDQLMMRKSKSAFSLQTHVTCVSSEKPQAYVARSRNLWITFKSDKKNSGAGFSIPYVTYNEEYQDLMEDIVTDGQLYKPYQHQQIFKNRDLLSALLDVIAQPIKFYMYANVSRTLVPDSFFKLLQPKVSRFFS